MKKVVLWSVCLLHQNVQCLLTGFCGKNALIGRWECLGRPNFFLWRAGQKKVTHGETRTRNLRFRRPTPYPLGHAGSAHNLEGGAVEWLEIPLKSIPWTMEWCHGLRDKNNKSNILQVTCLWSIALSLAPSWSLNTVGDQASWSSSHLLVKRKQDLSTPSFQFPGEEQAAGRWKRRRRRRRRKWEGEKKKKGKKLDRASFGFHWQPWPSG